MPQWGSAVAHNKVCTYACSALSSQVLEPGFPGGTKSRLKSVLGQAKTAVSAGTTTLSLSSRERKEVRVKQPMLLPAVGLPTWFLMLMQGRLPLCTSSGCLIIWKGVVSLPQMPTRSSFCSMKVWSGDVVEVGLDLRHVEVFCTAVSCTSFPAVQWHWPALENFQGRQAKLDSPAYCLAYLVSRCMCACCRRPSSLSHHRLAHEHGTWSCVCRGWLSLKAPVFNQQASRTL